MRHRAAGFTLIELMIVVVIIAILAAVVYPSYRSHVVTSNRAAAQSFMLSVAQRQEQLLLDRRIYVAATGNAQVLSNIGLEVPNEVAKFYTIAVTAFNPTGSDTEPPSFQITAEAIPGTAQADDPDLTLDSTGDRGPANLWK